MLYKKSVLNVIQFYNEQSITSLGVLFFHSFQHSAPFLFFTVLFSNHAGASKFCLVVSDHELIQQHFAAQHNIDESYVHLPDRMVVYLILSRPNPNQHG